jgi:DNA-binding transcriptional ArsR family regulator
MNKWLYLTFYILCVLCGLAGFAVDTYLNLEFVGFDNHGPAATIIVITVCSAISLSAATIAFKFRKYILGFMCIIGFVTSFFWSVPVTLSRIASTIDHKSVLRDNHDVKKKALERSYEEVKKLREEESKKGGCKDNCQKLLDRESSILAEIGKHGTTKTEDPAARRIAYILPNVSAEAVEMWIPMFAVISLTCLMNGLLAIGVFGLLDRKYKDEKHVIHPDKVLNIGNIELAKPSVSQVIRGSDNDPFVNIIRDNGKISISDIAHKSGKTLPYVSVYVSDLERKGIVSKNKEGRRTFIELRNRRR